MSSNNNRFTVTEERLEWELDDPWASLEGPEVSVDGDASGDDDTEEIERSERKRTLLIAGKGALAGGLLVAFVATMVMLSSSSGSASPRPVAYAPHRQPASKPVVVGPAPHPRRANPAATRQPKHTVTHTHTHTPTVVSHRTHRKAKKRHPAVPPKRHNHRPARHHTSQGWK